MPATRTAFVSVPTENIFFTPFLREDEIRVDGRVPFDVACVPIANVPLIMQGPRKSGGGGNPEKPRETRPGLN